MTGAELMEPLQAIEQQKLTDVKQYKALVDLMSGEKVVVMDIQLRPYRTDDFIPKLYYESARFTMYTYQWSVKARVNDSQDNPVHAINRSISYQLVLKTKPTTGVSVTFSALSGPFNDAALLPTICEFEFGPEAMESAYHELALASSTDCNRLLASKTINLRLVLLHNLK